MISIQDVNPEVFRLFKAEAVRENLTLGEAFTLALQQWMRHRKRHIPTWNEMFGRYKKIDMDAFAKQHAEAEHGHPS